MLIFNKIVAWTLPLIPRFIVGFFSKKYIAGPTLKHAVDRIKRFNEKGILTTVDILGEEIEKKEESINQVASDIVKFILISTKGMVVYNGSSDKDIVASAKKVLESAGVKDADAFIAKHKKD